MSSYILIPFSLLVFVGSIIIFLFFPPLSEALNYANTQHFFMQHLLVVCLGIGLLLVLYQLKASIWFDIIGASVLVMSLLLLTVRLFLPELLLGSYIGNMQPFGINILPFFTLGVFWLVDFMHNHHLGKLSWLMRGFCVLVFFFWMFSIIIYLPTALLLGLSVLATLFYIHKSNKVFYLLLASFVTIVTLILFIKYPHRIARIQSWVEVLTNKRESVPSEGLNHLVCRLHDGLFIFNEWSTGAFAAVAVLFTWLIVALWKNNDMFAKSIAILFGLDMLFHFIVFMNWSAIKSPILFMVEQGTSITVASFMMIGMVLLRLERKEDLKDEKYAPEI